MKYTYKTKHGMSLLTQNRVLAHNIRPERPLRWLLNGSKHRHAQMVKTRSMQHMLPKHKRGMLCNQTSMEIGLKWHIEGP